MISYEREWGTCARLWFRLVYLKARTAAKRALMLEVFRFLPSFSLRVEHHKRSTWNVEIIRTTSIHEGG